MTYKFKYKRSVFWKSVHVIGHDYNKSQDKMVVYFEGGALKEIKDWSSCELFLGLDWVLFIKKDMEQKAGQPVMLSVK